MTTAPRPAEADRFLRRLPDDFVWGSATASYQIEGAVTAGGRSRSIWDTFVRTPGAVLHGDTGDVACDHYHRWRDDVAMMGELGLTAYRLSLAWPRLQPAASGALNPAGVAFYRDLLGGLREVGIRPFVTLYHWDLPQVVEDAGGWPARDTADRFADYAGRVAAALGDLATNWITLNEPWCSAFLGYHDGVHAPGRRNADAAVAAAHHLNVAHGLAVRAIRNARDDASVGTSLNIVDVLPASDAAADVAAAERVDANANRMFLDPLFAGGYGEAVRRTHAAQDLAGLVRAGDDAIVAEPLDFLGINHYHQLLVAADDDEPLLGARQRHAEPAATGLGWSIRPESLRNVCLRVADEYTTLPQYVTENGACFEDYVDPDGQVKDTERVAYLDGYLAAAADARDAGANLAGYFVWSLLDNFEWAEGYRKRFGLVFVDYGTQTRVPKASFTWYRDVIARHRAQA